MLHGVGSPDESQKADGSRTVGEIRRSETDTRRQNEAATDKR